MRVIADSCPDGPCPKIFDLGGGEVAVQGYDDSGLATTSGEAVVRIPAYLVTEAADRLGSAAASRPAGDAAAWPAAESEPTVLDLGSGDLIVRGHRDNRITVPPGESLVRIPSALIMRAATRLRTGAPA